MSWRSYILIGLMISIGVGAPFIRPLAPENLGTVYLVMGTLIFSSIHFLRKGLSTHISQEIAKNSDSGKD